MGHSAMKKIRGSLLASVLAVAVPVAAWSETLADTLVSTYHSSGLLEQNRALLRAADEDVAVTLSQLRPILNWSVDVTRNFGRSKVSGNRRPIADTNTSLGITAEWLLYDFGRTGFRIEAAKETVLGTRQTLRSIEQQVLLRGVTAYLNVRRNQAFVDLRQNNLRLLEQELRAARDRFEVGEVTRTDVAQAEARLASARSGLAAAQGDLAQAVEEFVAAVGRQPDNLQPPGALPNLSGDVNQSKLVAARNHPDVLKARHDVAATELTIKAASAAMKPSVSLTGRAGVTEDFDDSDYTRSGSVGISVTGPIYQGGRLSALKRQAMARRDANRGALHVVQFRVQQEVGNAYASLRAARASRDASSEQVRAATVAFRGVREEATLGARTTLDVLNAEQELLNARATLISAEIDVYTAAYSVLAATGQLTAKDLNLPIKTYDPAAYYNMVKSAPVAISPQGRKLDRVLRALGKD